MSRNRILAIAVLLVTFGTGALAGHLMTRQLFVLPVQETVVPTPERQWQGQRQGMRIREMMVQELELQESQEDRFFETLMEYRQKSVWLFNESRANLETALESQAEELMTELSGILTPEQLDKFDQKFSRRAMMEHNRPTMRRRGGDGQGRGQR